MGKEFPILLDIQDLRDYKDCPKTNRWEIIATHAAQAMQNHDQTFERLAQRGGLSPIELLFVMQGKRWSLGISPLPGQIREKMWEAIKFLNRKINERKD